jgi:hypothetical protein
LPLFGFEIWIFAAGSRRPMGVNAGRRDRFRNAASSPRARGPVDPLWSASV